MKLAATLSNPQILHKLGTSLERLDKMWILTFSPHLFSITILSSSMSLHKLNFYSKIQISALFDPEGFVCTSLARDCIWLQVLGEHLIRALKSGLNSLSLKVKLAKKGTLPVLSLAITNQSRSGKRIHLVQDIPVRVLPQTLAAEFIDPVPRSVMALGVRLPSLDTLAKILDRVKHIDYRLSVRASPAGRLELITETNKIKIVSAFAGLGLRRPDGQRTPLPRRTNRNIDDLTSELQEEEEEEEMHFAPPTQSGGFPMSQAGDRDDFTQIDVDIRDFLKVLPCSVLHPVVECILYPSYGLVVKARIINGDETFVTLSYHLPIKET